MCLTEAKAEVRAYLDHKRLEGTAEIVYSNFPATGRDTSQLDFVAQHIIQSGLKHLQRGGIHNPSGQPVPGIS